MAFSLSILSCMPSSLGDSSSLSSNFYEDNLLRWYYEFVTDYFRIEPVLIWLSMLAMEHGVRSLHFSNEFLLLNYYYGTFSPSSNDAWATITGSKCCSEDDDSSQIGSMKCYGSNPQSLRRSRFTRKSSGACFAMLIRRRYRQSNSVSQGSSFHVVI